LTSSFAVDGSAAVSAAAFSTAAVDALSSTLSGFSTGVPHSLQKLAVGLKGAPQDLHNFISVINSVYIIATKP
jgi:hypothetical protein